MVDVTSVISGDIHFVSIILTLSRSKCETRFQTKVKCKKGDRISVANFLLLHENYYLVSVFRSIEMKVVLKPSAKFCLDYEELATES